MERFPIFESYEFGEEQRAEMDRGRAFRSPRHLDAEGVRTVDRIAVVHSIASSKCD